ncbi:MAG: hypothetical protein J5863_01595 [Desulfovibrio sp.]|nr:hypothetical protein [Desulfovibrio sp.]
MAFAVASVMATAEAPAVQAKDPKTETLTSENASTTMADEDTGPADDVLPLADGGTVFSETAQAGEDIVPEAGEDIDPEGDGADLADEATVQTEKSQAEKIASPEDGGIDGPVGAVPDLADRTSVQTEANQAEDDAPAKTTTRKSRSPLRAQEICALTPGRRCRNMTETTRLANVATSTVASIAASAWRP